MRIQLNAGEWKQISTSVGTVQNAGEYPVLVKVSETKPTSEDEGVEVIPLKIIPVTPEENEKVFAYCENTGFVEVYDPVPMVAYDGTKFVVLKANNGKLEVSGTFEAEIDKATVEQSDASKLKNTELNSGDIKTLLTAIKNTDGIKKIVDAITETNSGSIKTASEALVTLLTAIKNTDGIKKIVDDVTETNSGDIKTAVEAIQTGQKDGEQKSKIVDEQTGKSVTVDTLGSLNVSEVERLAGTTFSGTTKDPNFWIEDNDGSGSIVQAGEVILATGSTADSRARYATMERGRKVTGIANQFRAVARNKQSPQANCVRRIGAYDSQEGFFFQFNGTTFGVGVRKGGLDTIVNNGSFNGNLGSTIDLGGATDFTKVVIEYTALSAKFFVNGGLLHTVKATTTSLTNSLNLKIQMEVYNENGNTSNNEYEVLFACIVSKGKSRTQVVSKFLEGDSSPVTTVLKRGAGRLAQVIIPDNASGMIEIYDGLSALGRKIIEIDTGQGSEPLGGIEFNCNFNDGLTVVVAGSDTKITVFYE